MDYQDDPAQEVGGDDPLSSPTPAPPSQPPKPSMPPPTSAEAASRPYDAELGSYRSNLRETQQKRRQAYEEQQGLEDKVMTAVQGRTTAALHGAKDLFAFVKRNAELEDMSAKNYSNLSTLFGQETGTTNDALLGFSSACKAMMKLHTDMKDMLVQQELPKVQESLQGVEEGVKKVMGKGTSMTADKQSAREKLNKAFQAQERAWEESEGHAKNKTKPSTADTDPWLTGLRYQAASKGLEKVEGTHGGDLRELITDLRTIDQKRLDTMKNVLKTYAEAQRDLLSKALQNAEEFCKMVDQIQPQADCSDFLEAAGVKEDDLQQLSQPQEEEEKKEQDLGVWIPDDAVKHCGSCEGAFGLMKRKHHCRRCGHVFCDKCSSNSAVLPASFGLGQAPQRVCGGCFAILQSEGGGEEDQVSSVMTKALDFEVLKEGSLIKKTTVMGKSSGLSKNRHVVCTKAGFLHLFESKFDLHPKSSVNLHTAKVMTVDDDACAIAIESDEIVQSGVTFWRGKSTKKKNILRSAQGSLERDAWIKVMRLFASGDAPAASSDVFSETP